MDLNHLHFDRSVPRAERKPFYTHMTEGFGAPEKSILVTKELQKNQLFFTPLYHIYLIGDDLNGLIDHLKEIPDPEDGTILTIIATSASLHKAGLPEHIELYLKQQEYLDHAHAHTFKLALQESVMNAIEHGNLGLSEKKKEFSQKSDGLIQFHKHVESLLKEEEHANTRVIVRVHMQDGLLSTSIEDFGEGFDYRSVMKDSKKQAKDDSTAGSGRGIDIMLRSTIHFGFDQGGRRVKFAVPALNRPEISKHLRPISTEEIKNTSKILLVDDQEINVTQMKEFLIRDGYKHIFTAENGIEAVKVAVNHQPDIILMDIIMPEMDGFEACKRLKIAEATADIPVLFLSGLTDSGNRAQGYTLGAVDYINKPIDRDEFLARTLVHLQNGLQRRMMRSYSEYIRNELQKARLFQKSLLPDDQQIKRMIDTHKTYIEMAMISCDELAGDYISAYEIDDEHLAVIMADFTGHGLSAALHTIWLDAILKELQSSAHDPVKLMSDLNDNLFNVLAVEQFATCFYGVLNTKTGDFKYISAGAPEVLHFDSKGALQKPLKAAGLPLGIIPSKDLGLELETITLHCCDSLMLYSDALVETTHRGKNMWDKSYITGLAGRILSEEKPLLHGIRKAFYRSADLPLRDDLSLMTIEWQPEK